MELKINLRKNELFMELDYGKAKDFAERWDMAIEGLKNEKFLVDNKFKVVSTHKYKKAFKTYQALETQLKDISWFAQEADLIKHLIEEFKDNNL